MADTYPDREEAKRRLRANMIDAGSERGDRKRPSLFSCLLILILLILLGLGSWAFYTHTTRTAYSVSWERAEETSGSESFKGYLAFAGGVVRYTRDGAEFIDKDGNVVWERSYQMTAPIADASDTYAVIADQGYESMYIFDEHSLTGVSETLLPISIVRVSDNGVVYAVIADSDADYITAFKSDGSAIDLSVKSILTGDGFPFDIDVSPDGTELITAYVSLSEGEAQSSVVFRNFGTVGQNADSRRIVGGFMDEFEGHMAGLVHFSTDEYSQAFYDGGVVFFSTKVLNTPAVLANHSIDERMIAVAVGTKVSAVLIENEAEENEVSGETGIMEEAAPYRLLIYQNSTGEQKGDVTVDIAYKSIFINRDTTVVYDSQSIRGYSGSGFQSYALEFEGGDISAVLPSGRSNALYVMSSDTIYSVRF